MKDFKDKVAVITGAASGIGLGMAEVFAKQGMKIVLADIEKGPLQDAEKKIKGMGVEVLAVETDVTSSESVEALAHNSFDHFEKVHILCNNAGVSGGGSGQPGIWNTSLKDWSWVMGVNFMGVVHGMQSFIPRMLSHGEDGHIVNTSSVLGVWTGAGAAYGVSKHAVTRLTEGLFYDLKAQGSKLKASVLMPGLIATNIIRSSRNRPKNLANENAPHLEDWIKKTVDSIDKYFADNGMPPMQVGQIVLDAIKEEKFYVFTHPKSEELVESRLKAIINGQDPPELREGMEIGVNKK